MATTPTCIIAYTAEDDRYHAVRNAAVEMAKSSDARLILYDIDAAPGALGGLTKPMDGAPLPTAWSGDGSTEQFPDRLSPADLERAGRHAIAGQVTSARDLGIDAFAWLPAKKGGDYLADYARGQGADLILLPQELKDPGLIKRLRKESFDETAKDADVPVGIVDESGQIEYPVHEE
jgi:hypothetical protein